MAAPFLWLLGRHPRVLFALLVAVTLGMMAGAARFRRDDVPKNLFASDSEDFKVLARVERDFSTDENDCLVVVRSPDGLFAPAPMAAYRRLVRELGDLEGVASVLGLGSIPVFEPGGGSGTLLPAEGSRPEEFDRALQRATAHPLVGGHLLSLDGRTTLVFVRLEGGDLSVAHMAGVLPKVRAACDRAEASGGVTCYLTGVPAIRVAILETMKRDQIVFTAAGAAISIVLGLFLFRSVAATVLVCSGPFVGLVWTIGALGLLGLEINAISSILPTLVIVIGFTDSVHLGLDFRRQREEGAPRREAALNTLRRLAMPCGVTSLTTAVGFGSLLVADIPSIRGLGLVTAIGAICTFLAVILVIPFLASTFLGERVGRSRPSSVGEGSPRWEALSKWITRRPRGIAIAGVLVTAALVGVATRLDPDTRLSESVPTHYEAFQGLVICDRELGGVMEAHVLVEWDPGAGAAAQIGAIRAAEEVVKGSPVVGSSLSIRDVLAVALSATGASGPAAEAVALRLVPEKARARFHREDRRRALVRLRVPDEFASKTRPEFDRLQAALKGLEPRHPGFRFELTGPVVVIGREIREMIGELLKSLGVAAVVIFAILSVSFRSIRFGLISLVPNVFPMAVTAAVIVAAGWPLLIANVIVFSVCLGVAVDDTIHFMAAYRGARREGLGAGDAVTRSLVRVGTALLVTTAVLVTGFATTLVGELGVMRMFGALACTAIASALAGDLFFLPALLVWVGEAGGRK